MIQRKLAAVMLSLTLAISSLAQLQRAGSFGPSVSAGIVSANIRGTGSSSGSAIRVSIAKTPKAGPGPVSISVPPGTMLRSRDGAVQNMVVAGVLGRWAGGDSYYPSSNIVVSGSTPVDYVLEAYCAEFEKDNPSETTGFDVESPDPTLANIFKQATNLSTAAKQAAVWLYTDDMTYDRMSEKMAINSLDWARAEAAVRRAQTLNSPVELTAGNAIDSTSPTFRPFDGLQTPSRSTTAEPLILYPGVVLTVENRTPFTLRGRLGTSTFSVEPRSRVELEMILLGEDTWKRVFSYTVSAGGQSVSGKKLLRMGSYTWTFKTHTVGPRGRNVLRDALVRDPTEVLEVIQP
jgi:hypothetical protein